jgi:uncharacterized tellurite resistance protein B-like protein
MAAKLLALISKYGWPAVKQAANWLAKQGWDRVKKNLSPEERKEFLGLLGKMKHKPSNLSKKEKERLKALVQKALRKPDK